MDELRFSHRLPPYVSFTLWQKLLENLRQSPTNRLDGRYYRQIGFSKSQMLAMKSALLFLKLVGYDNTPTPILGGLTRLNHDEYKATLRIVVDSAYGPLLGELRSMTVRELRLYFQDLGAQGEIQRKCATFFLNIAHEAGIELPTQLSKSPRRTKRVASPRKATDLSPLSIAFKKFPNLDPNWSEATKIRWFEDFGKLIDLSMRLRN